MRSSSGGPGAIPAHHLLPTTRRTIRRRAACLLACFVLAVLVQLLSAGPVSAHPLGNFTVNRYARIEPSAGALRIHYVIDYAELPAYQVRDQVDADPDGFADRLVASTIDGLDVTVDGEPLALRPAEAELTRPPGQAGMRRLRIDALLEADLPSHQPDEVLDATVVDRNEPERLGWRELIVAPTGDATVVESSVPREDASNALRDYPRERLNDPLVVRRASFTFTPGSETASAAGPRLTDAVAGAGDLLGAQLTRDGVTPIVLIGMLAIAALVGAGHALAPGHGKTVMAAYLVGTKGRPVDAVLLGVVVSGMHTLSVLLLGVALLGVQRSVSLDRLYPILTMLSGAGVLLVGAWLARRWARELRSTPPASHHHHGSHAHHQPLAAEVAPLSRRGLVLLASAGGAVPSPSAVVLLVSAFALGRVALGLGLVLAFSAGLAATVTAVGLAFVFGSRALGGRVSDRFAALARFGGAVVPCWSARCCSGRASAPSEPASAAALDDSEHKGFDEFEYSRGMSDSSPFPYQGPLAPEQVAGRDQLQRDLAERLMERRLTALLGPRRYGKTSVLRRVAADLAAVGPQTVWIDLYGLTSMADLAAAVDRGLSEVQGGARRALESLAGSLSLRLGLLGVELSKGRRDRPDPALALQTLLDLLLRTAQRQSLVLVIDEFAGIANVEGGAALLRTALQHHYTELGIVFAGSEPSTMEMLFGDRTQPFFAQADLVRIDPLDDEAVVNLVKDGFTSTDRATGGMTSRLVALAAGHPQRAMQLADALWRRTPPGGAADEVAWEDALQSVRVDVASGSERFYTLLPTGQQKTLRVLAAGGSIYGTAADVLDLNPGTARPAVDALLGAGTVSRRADRLTIVDPLFADWLRRRFPI